MRRTSVRVNINEGWSQYPQYTSGATASPMSRKLGPGTSTTRSTGILRTRICCRTFCVHKSSASNYRRCKRNTSITQWNVERGSRLATHNINGFDRIEMLQVLLVCMLLDPENKTCSHYVNICISSKRYILLPFDPQDTCWQEGNLLAVSPSMRSRDALKTPARTIPVTDIIWMLCKGWSERHCWNDQISKWNKSHQSQ